MTKNIFLKVAYDGSRYFGFQKTKTGPSVEDELQKVLETVLQQKITIQVASRTDRGVHALGQVINFNADKIPSLMSLHRLLPEDIAALDIKEMPNDFHATLSATSKTYCYDLTTLPFQIPQERFYEWHHPSKLNLSLMLKGANELLGLRDFKALTNKKEGEAYCSTTRLVSSIVIEQPSIGNFRFTVTGKNFLYKMVRNIVGLLISVGEGKIDPTQICSILASQDRKHPFMSAPAHGLTLVSLDYE